MTMKNGNIDGGVATDLSMVSFGEIAATLGVRPEAVAAVVRKRQIPHQRRPPFIFVDRRHLDEIRDVFTPPSHRI